MPATDLPNSPRHYDERVVALVDVLGWKDLLTQNPGRPPALAYKAVERLQLERSSQAAAANSGYHVPGTNLTIYQVTVADQYSNYGISSDVPNEGDFQLSQFSDHLLLSCSTNGPAPSVMVDRLSNLLWTMLADGILLRGAVVVGKLQHTSAIALGPALVRAHELESTVAIYPRVVVDDALEDVINHPDPPSVELDRLKGQPLRRDRDGLLFIDFIRMRFLRGTEVDHMETWQCIRDRLTDRSRQHAEKPDVLAKDNWMISYFNDVVRQAPQLASLEIRRH